MLWRRIRNEVLTNGVGAGLLRVSSARAKSRAAQEDMADCGWVKYTGIMYVPPTESLHNKYSRCAQYEIDDGTEIHNTSLPSTTSCPYLPGQPVNILDVPEERNPSHGRSSSLNMLSGMPQTVRPEDKFLPPKAAPCLPPTFPRLHTSPAKVELSDSTQPDQSSPRKRRLPWLPRDYWALWPEVLSKSSVEVTTNQDSGHRGSSVLEAALEVSLLSSSPARSCGHNDGSTTPESRSTSPAGSPVLQYKSSLPKPSPVISSSRRKPIIPSRSMTHPLCIPDDILEEDCEVLADEDEDHNSFALELAKDDSNSVDVTKTQGSKRYISREASPVAKLRRAISDMRPVPMLPFQLQTCPNTENSVGETKGDLSRSDTLFSKSQSMSSMDTFSSDLISPTSSKMSTPSIYSSTDDEDGTSERHYSLPWDGYSLPAEEARSEMTLKDEDFQIEQDSKQSYEGVQNKRSSIMIELGYLGDMIG